MVMYIDAFCKARSLALPLLSDDLLCILALNFPLLSLSLLSPVYTWRTFISVKLNNN